MQKSKKIVGAALILSMVASVTAQADTSLALQRLLSLKNQSASQNISMTDIKVADCTELSIYANKTKREMDNLMNQIETLAQNDLKLQSQLKAEKLKAEETLKLKQAELAAQEAAKQQALTAAAQAVTAVTPSTGGGLLGSLVSAVASAAPGGNLIGALATGLASGLSAPQQAAATTGLTAAQTEAAVAEAKRLAEQKALELKQAEAAARDIESKYAPKLDENEVNNLMAKYSKLESDTDAIRIYQSSKGCM